MAIDPQAVQILGMVLDRQQREQEGEAYRGHQINMANINVAQRNLENQISMNFQRQQNTENQINNLQNTLMGMGIDTNRFGSDSQLGEMAEKISGSLVNKNKQLSELTDLQLEELQSLRDMGSAFTRGATVASKFQAKFDENFELDPTSDFGSFNLAVGDESRMAELFEERGIDYGTDPRERHAFIQGASGAFSDTSSALERERFKMEALAAKRRANNELLQRENLDLANFKARLQLSKDMAFDPTPLITGDLMTLADPEADSGEKERLQDDINTRITAGSRSFTTQIAGMVGDDLENLLNLEESGQLSDEQKSTIKYYRDLEDHYKTTSVRHINNLVSNPTAFTSSVQKSGKELEKALAEFGTLENAIKNKAIAPTDLGNILGFVGNPYLNDTIGGGFQAFNEIINIAKAQEEIMENNNPSTAVQKATDAYNREIGIEMGDALRTFMSRNVFPETGDAGGGNEDSDNVDLMSIFAGRDTEVEDESESPAIDRNLGSRAFEKPYDTVRGLFGRTGGTIATIATTVPRGLLNAAGRVFEAKAQADETIVQGLNNKLKEAYGDDWETVYQNAVESNPDLDENYLKRLLIDSPEIFIGNNQ